MSGIARPKRLKLVTHVENGWMYRIYRNHAAALIRPFNFFIFLSLQFLDFKKFSSHFSQELWGREDWNLVHTWTVGRCIVYTWIRLLLHICPFISSFFFLSNFLTLKFFVTLFSGTVRPRRLKLSTHVDSWQLYRAYRNQAAAAHSALCFSFFFPSNFQTLKIFVILFSRTVRPRRETLVHPVIFSFFSLQFSVANLSFSSYSAIAGL